LSVADSIFNALKLLVPLALVAVLIVAMLALGMSTLLTIAVAALGALWTAGIAGFVGLPVTPATLVVLPVVLGLATDYFIQSVNRVMETPGTPQERVNRAARRILPSTGLAAAATAAGMLAFVISGIPLVRQFGLFMALGVAMAYLANYLVGLPLLLLLARTIPSVLNANGMRAAAGQPPSPGAISRRWKACLSSSPASTRGRCRTPAEPRSSSIGSRAISPAPFTTSSEAWPFPSSA